MAKRTLSNERWRGIDPSNGQPICAMDLAMGMEDWPGVVWTHDATGETSVSSKEDLDALIYAKWDERRRRDVEALRRPNVPARIRLGLERNQAKAEAELAKLETP